MARFGGLAGCHAWAPRSLGGPCLSRLDNNNFGKAPSAFAAFTDAMEHNSTLKVLTLCNNHFNDTPSFRKLATNCRVPTLVFANNRTLGTVAMPPCT